MKPTDLARDAADDGNESERWQRNRLKVSMINDLLAVEQLSERIANQCSAQLKLASMIAGYRFDDDSLRAIRLAVNSATEALDSIERLCAEVDRVEFGAPVPYTRYECSAEYGNNLDAVEELTSELSVLANAEAYLLKLIASRRRPAPEVIAGMRYLHGKIRAILG